MRTNLNIDHIEKENFAIHARVGRMTTTLHTHDRHKLLYAEDGVLHLQTEGHQFLLPAWHGAWIPGHYSHRVYSNSPKLYWRTLYFKTGEPEEPVLQQLHLFPISNLAREMILQTQTWEVAQEAGLLEQHFFQTMRLLIPEWCQKSLPLILPATEHPHLAQVTAYVKENLAEPLHLEPLAKQYGFSGRTLLRLFKKELGMTFGTYLRVARITRALELLTEPDASVTEVAYAVGYESPSSFSQTFYQLVGMRPQAYLKGRN